MKSMAVFQLKGGVGKTTSAVNLAALAAREGMRTLLWDLDPQGAASWILGVDAERKQDKIWSAGKPIGRYIQRSRYDRLDVLPADLSLRHFNDSVVDRESALLQMKEAIDRLGEDYELLILDCPPMLSPQIEGVLQAVDYLLVPIEPSILSIRAYQQCREHLDWVKKRQWLPFVTLIDRRKAAHVEWVRETAPTMPELLSTVITHSASAERMLEDREPIVCSQPYVPLSRNYEALWATVCERTGMRAPQAERQ